jgi:cytochrome P450 monooxygenase
MTSLDDLPAHMTADKPHMLDLCPHLRELRGMAPVRQVRTVAGDQAWHVTGYREVKQLFADERLGRSHPDPDNMPKFLGKDSRSDFVLSDDHDTADQIHSLMRTMLKPQFAVKHMENLRPRVDALADKLLTAAITKGPPVDLHAGLSVPMVLESVWELLGVHANDRSQWTTVMSSSGDDERETAIPDMIAKLLREKRETPGDDLVSRLYEATDRDELVHVLTKTVFAGFGAMIKTIDYGIALLTQNPEQRDAVARDPALLANAAEEILRLSGGVSLPRYARQDIEIGDVTIRPNELVLIDLTCANLNDDVFDTPDRFDITRMPNRHLTFAHGAWSCLGSPFARLILRSVFSRLLVHLPTLSLAVSADQLISRHNDHLSGLVEVPVTW